MVRSYTCNRCLVVKYPAVLLQEDTILDPCSGLPLPHLDFLYQDITSSPFVLLPSGAYRNSGNMRHKVKDDIGFYGKVVGFWINILDLLPEVPRSKPGFLNTWQEVHHCLCICQFDNKSPLNIYCIPDDTDVFTSCEPGVQESDLIMESDFGKPGYIRLKPVLDKQWQGALTKEEEGNVYLRHLEVNEPFPPKLHACWEELDYGVAILAFRCPWPKEADEWRTRKRSTDWLQTSTQQTILQEGCYILPCGRRSNSAIDWKFCFDCAEEWLIRRCVYDHFSSVYRTFRLLIKTLIKEKAEASSYRQLLRHIFYYACEEVPEKDWIKRPALCILFMLSKLMQQLTAGIVPHYFMNNVNLLDLEDIDRDELLKSVSIIREYPLLCTYYLLEERLLTFTHIRLKLDHAIDDISKYSEHKNLQRSKENFFTAEKMRQICILVQEGKLGEADDLSNAILIEMHEDGKNIPLTDILQEVLFNMNYLDRWCFAFYTDLVEKTRLLELVCSGVPSSTLSHILGPEISRAISHCMVPNECVMPNTIVDFVNKVTFILEQINWFKSVFHALIFFLDQAYDEKTKTYDFDLTEENFVAKRESAAIQMSKYTCHEKYYYRRNVLLACIYRRLFKAGRAIKHPEFKMASYISGYEDVCDRIQIDRFCSDLGRILISFGNEERGKRLLEKAKSCRKPANWILNEICVIENRDILLKYRLGLVTLFVQDT